MASFQISDFKFTMAKANIKDTKCPAKCKRRLEEKEVIHMKMEFYILLENIIVRLQKNKISPEKVISVLPKDVAAQLESLEANEIHELFKAGSPLYNVLDWRSLKILILVTNVLKDEVLNKALRNYCAMLVNYNIRHGSQIVVCDSGIVIPHHNCAA